MHNPRMKQMPLHRVLQQAIINTRPRHLLIQLNRPLILPLLRRQLRNLDIQLPCHALRIVSFIPLRRQIVRFYCALVVANLLLVQLCDLLLLSGGSSPVSFGREVLDGALEDAGSVFGVGLAVGFEGFEEGVCGVIGLGELFGLDAGGALEG